MEPSSNDCPSSQFIGRGPAGRAIGLGGWSAKIPAPQLEWRIYRSTDFVQTLTTSRNGTSFAFGSDLSGTRRRTLAWDVAASGIPNPVLRRIHNAALGAHSARRPLWKTLRAPIISLNRQASHRMHPPSRSDDRFRRNLIVVPANARKVRPQHREFTSSCYNKY